MNMRLENLVKSMHPSSENPNEDPPAYIPALQLLYAREAWLSIQKKQFQSTSLRDMGSIMIVSEENVSPFHLSNLRDLS